MLRSSPSSTVEASCSPAFTTSLLRRTSGKATTCRSPLSTLAAEIRLTTQSAGLLRMPSSLVMSLRGTSRIWRLGVCPGSTR